MNILKPELIAKYNTKSRSSGVGEWTTRLNVKAMDIRPEPFYKNNYKSGVESGILMDEFAPNTQYVFDCWVDADDVTYQGNNVQCGFTIVYTDGTTNTSFVFLGGNKGYQHSRLITPANKSVSHLDVYYYTSMPVYYRWDSSITPLTDIKFNKSGIINTGTVTVHNVDNLEAVKGGLISAVDIIEN